MTEDALSTLHTDDPSPRAIAWLAFFAAAVGLAGCSPDLSRSSGVLAIRVLGLPLETTRVRALLGTGGASYQVEAEVAAFTGELVAESVPFGDVQIVVEALGPGGITRREQSTRVAAAFTSVIFDFGTAMDTDGGVPEPRHADTSPIPFVVRGLRGSSVRGGLLSGEADARDGDGYSINLDAATAQLGGPPAAIGVRAVAIDLLQETAENTAGLELLFSGRVQVALEPRSGGAGIAVASATAVLGAEPVMLETSVVRADLAPIAANLASGDFMVVLSGPTPRSAADDFQADVLVSVIFTAYAE